MLSLLLLFITWNNWNSGGVVNNSPGWLSPHYCLYYSMGVNILGKLLRNFFWWSPSLWYLLILYAKRVQKERVMDSPTMYITAFRWSWGEMQVEGNCFDTILRMCLMCIRSGVSLAGIKSLSSSPILTSTTYIRYYIHKLVDIIHLVDIISLSNQH